VERETKFYLLTPVDPVGLLEEDQELHLPQFAAVRIDRSMTRAWIEQFGPAFRGQTESRRISWPVELYLLDLGQPVESRLADELEESVQQIDLGEFLLLEAGEEEVRALAVNEVHSPLLHLYVDRPGMLYFSGIEPDSQVTCRSGDLWLVEINDRLRKLERVMH
jgi:hypothetical protein